MGHDIYNMPRDNITEECVVMKNFIKEKVRIFYGIDEFHYMFNTDADSIIEKESLYKLMQNIIRNKSTACCGIVVIDFSEAQYGFWNLYQNFQYLYGQYIRRGTEHIMSKVTCMPGCITMTKIDEMSKPIDNVFYITQRRFISRNNCSNVGNR